MILPNISLFLFKFVLEDVPQKVLYGLRYSGVKFPRKNMDLIVLIYADYIALIKDKA